MKTFGKFCLTFLIIILSGLFNELYAQAKDDVLIMLSGERKAGKVVSVKDDSVKFTYKGEALEYEFKKADIAEIEFASGRKEVVTAVTKPGADIQTAADRKGKIAVLPYNFITNEGSLNPIEMGKELQADTYNSLRENTALLQVQDPMTTNSILAKQGFTQDKISLLSPKEMAQLLGVEYVVYGVANITNKGTSTYGSGYSTSTDKDKEKKQAGQTDKKTTGTTFGANNSTTTTNYNTKIEMNFFNDQGVSVYSETRNSFGTGFDASRATINYLIKRCPFGTKAKK